MRSIYCAQLRNCPHTLTEKNVWNKLLSATFRVQIQEPVFSKCSGLLFYVNLRLHLIDWVRRICTSPRKDADKAGFLPNTFAQAGSFTAQFLPVPCAWQTPIHPSRRRMLRCALQCAFCNQGPSSGLQRRTQKMVSVTVFSCVLWMATGSTTLEPRSEGSLIPRKKEAVGAIQVDFSHRTLLRKRPLRHFLVIWFYLWEKAQGH